MRVFLFDTATDFLVAGIGEIRDDDSFTVIASGDCPAPRRANTLLLPRMQELMEVTGFAPSDMEGVVCGRGPGSFTGVRIGVATAKGVAQGLGVPLWGVSTLDSIAHRLAHAGFEGELGVVGDAMRGEVYPALFTITGGTVSRHAPDYVTKPEACADAWAAFPGGLALAGNGLRKYAPIFSERMGEGARFVEETYWTPDSEGLLSAFVDARRRGTAGSGDPVELLPIYTRLSDAEETERERKGLGPTTPPATGVSGATS